MSISIETPSGHRLAEARRISVHGLPGVGGYTLVINLHLSVMAPTTETLLSNRSIRVDWGDNQQRMIGIGVPNQAQPIRLTVRAILPRPEGRGLPRTRSSMSMFSPVPAMYPSSQLMSIPL